MNYNSDYLLDEFRVAYRNKELNTVKIRLFPFGEVHKGESVYNVTPELAAQFRFPHFKPPLKLGSHKEETPSGGSFVNLEVGSDGLYGIIGLNGEGELAFDRQAYRYHSPEVIWPGHGIQDPKTGELLEGPLLVGAALLHNPHLGEDAALYSVEEPKLIDRGANKMEMTQVPTSLWDRFEAWLFSREQNTPEPQPERQPEPNAVPDEYAAQLQEKEGEIERLKAEIAQVQEAQARQERIDHFAAELGDEVEDVHVLLAELPEEAASALVVRFKALHAEARLQPDDTAGARGTNEEPMAPEDRLNKIIEEYAAENNVLYHEAFNAVREQRPELFTASGGE